MHRTTHTFKNRTQCNGDIEEAPSIGGVGRPCVGKYMASLQPCQQNLKTPKKLHSNTGVPLRHPTISRMSWSETTTETPDSLSRRMSVISFCSVGHGKDKTRSKIAQEASSCSDQGHMVRHTDSHLNTIAVKRHGERHQVSRARRGESERERGDGSVSA